MKCFLGLFVCLFVFNLKHRTDHLTIRSLCTAGNNAGNLLPTNPVVLTWSIHRVPGTTTVLTCGSGEFQESPEKLFTIAQGLENLGHTLDVLYLHAKLHYISAC